MSAFGESRRMARHTVTPSRPGQHQVEDDQIEVARARELKGRLSPSQRFDGYELFEPKVQADELSDVGLVLDDEDGRTRTDWASHSPQSSARSW